MQIVTTWNKQASVVKNTDIIITNYDLIKQKKAKITCLCDFCFLLFFCFLFFFCLQLGADWEAISKTRASCFTGVSKHSKRIKSVFIISFLVSGNPGKTLALVFEILHNDYLLANVIDAFLSLFWQTKLRRWRLRVSHLFCSCSFGYCF